MLQIKYIIHEDPQGGYWAEVPDIPGCVTEAETLEELEQMVRDAVEGCLFVYLERLRQQRPKKQQKKSPTGTWATVAL